MAVSWTGIAGSESATSAANCRSDRSGRGQEKKKTAMTSTTVTMAGTSHLGLRATGFFSPQWGQSRELAAISLWHCRQIAARPKCESLLRCSLRENPHSGHVEATLNTLWPYRPVGPGVNFTYITDYTIPEHLTEQPVVI